MWPYEKVNDRSQLLKNLTWLMPNKSQEKTRDRVEKSTTAAKRLKILAGDTRDMNKSKINLDSWWESTEL